MQTAGMLRDTLNNTQYVGHGKEVQEALKALDLIDDSLEGMWQGRLSGSLAPASSANGGLAALPGGGMLPPGMLAQGMPKNIQALYQQGMEEYAKAGPLMEYMAKALGDAERMRLIQDQYAKGLAAYDATQGKNQIIQAEGGETTKKDGSENIGQDEPDSGIIAKVRRLTKEGWADGEQREETRDDFARRCVSEGLRSYEGKTAIFGYREAGDIHSQKTAGRQVQRELKDLGLGSVVMDGTLWIHKNEHSIKQFVSEAATIPGELIIINSEVGTLPRETAGHEAFHFWCGTKAREKYVEVLQASLDYSSQVFRDYQDSFVKHYFDGEVNISDIKQMQLFQEELFAYISGDIHEGSHEDALRRMLRDYDAVKAAWEALIREQQELW